MVRTRIIATLGPASSSERVVERMAAAGMAVARLNFSHGSHEEHASRIKQVRDLDSRLDRHVGVLQDLQGNRIRVGELKGHGPVTLRQHQTVRLTQEDVVGTGAVIPFDYAGDLGDIDIGQRIYIDDGAICLVVRGREERALRTSVIVGGSLREHKGVNIPGAPLHFPPISTEDVRDIRFGVAHGVDYVAQSFVRTTDDVLRVRELVGDSLPSCRVVAKVETQEAIRNIDDIIEVADGIMIARGDMGISVPVEEVPIIQKRIIAKCNRADRFVITATQMLESMTENPGPTRAEVADVANAVLDGTDFAMLSGETAVGCDPVAVVSMMQRIIAFTESAELV